jgi:hypothetical protein
MSVILSKIKNQTAEVISWLRSLGNSPMMALKVAQ